MAKFLICKHCGNLVEVIDDKKVPMMCCGEKMSEIEANTTEAATEKHIPVVTQNDNHVEIVVGSTPHPMEEAHYIAWIYIETNKGSYRFNLKPGNEPKVNLLLSENEQILATYAYCNLHSLWVNK